MKVLFVSGELIGADLCYRLKKEGCDVRLYIEDESRKDCLEGMVTKTDDWKKELGWVGKDGLIVFDDVGYGEIQDKLRSQGFLVVGGSAGGDELELNREYCQHIFSSHGVGFVDSRKFYNFDEAIDFVQCNKGKWVVKQDGHTSMLNYVGQMDDGSDVISVLENYRNSHNMSSVNLQKYISGIEIAVARYFNGTDWVGTSELNIEHKCLCNNDIGPKTGEMGTVMWYDEDGNNRIFTNTLAKLKPYLKQINFKGAIDINFIINEDGAFPIEATARFGCPSTQLQAQLHQSPWRELLLAIAKGEQHNLEYKKGYGIVVSIAIPPFPYKAISGEYYLRGVDILFKGNLTEEEMNSIHFEEVSLKNHNSSHYCIAGSNGYILYVSGSGGTIQEARQRVYKLIDKIVIPKMFYRTDIGVKFIDNDMELLKKWGWL